MESKEYHFENFMENVGNSVKSNILSLIPEKEWKKLIESEIIRHSRPMPGRDKITNIYIMLSVILKKIEKIEKTLMVFSNPRSATIKDINRISLPDAAEYLQISQSQMYKLAASKAIKSSRVPKGKHWFTKNDLDYWKSNSVLPSPQA